MLLVLWLLVLLVMRVLMLLILLRLWRSRRRLDGIILRWATTEEISFEGLCRVVLGRLLMLLLLRMAGVESAWLDRAVSGSSSRIDSFLVGCREGRTNGETMRAI